MPCLRDPGSNRIVTRADFAAILVFVLVAAGVQFGRWAEQYPFLYGDAGNVASFAAAWDHPELFSNDNLLGNPEHFRFYASIHVPLIRWLGWITGDYAIAFTGLLGPLVLVQAVGFYIFARMLYRRRLWAVLLAIAGLMLVPLNLGTFWGIYRDPISRVLFQALLPYLLAGAYYWRRAPAFSPIAMILAGLLIYVHPPGAPAWALALWLGMWLYHPAAWSWKKRFVIMFALGLVFLAIAAPFAVHYTLHHAHGPTADYEQVHRIAEHRFSTGFLNVPAAVMEFLRLSGKYFIGPLGLVGWLLMHWRRRQKLRELLLLDAWLAGVAITAILIPFTEQQVARAMHSMPLQVDLTRNLRFFVPFMLIFSLWPLVELDHLLTNRRLGRIPGAFYPAVIGVVLVGIWVAWRAPAMQPVHAARCWLEGHVSQGQLERAAAFDMLQHIRAETKPGERIMPFDFRRVLALRYYARRPVVWCEKDGGLLAYTDYPALLAWHETEQRMWVIDNLNSKQERTRARLELSRGLGAEYMLLKNSDLDPTAIPEAQVTYTNDTYTLLRL
ncbi:MAG: hypothetical protein ABIG44_17465 [Planctomycetota bacterium]